MSDDGECVHKACYAKRYICVVLELQRVERRTENAIRKAMNINSSSIENQSSKQSVLQTAKISKVRLVLGTALLVTAYAMMTEGSRGIARNDADTSTM